MIRIFPASGFADAPVSCKRRPTVSSRRHHGRRAAGEAPGAGSWPVQHGQNHGGQNHGGNDLRVLLSWPCGSAPRRSRGPSDRSPPTIGPASFLANSDATSAPYLCDITQSGYFDASVLPLNPSFGFYSRRRTSNRSWQPSWVTRSQRLQHAPIIAALRTHGTTSFLSTIDAQMIRHLIGRDFPSADVGPEPTTDGFRVIMSGSEERTIKGTALCMVDELPFGGLAQFGAPFLDKLEVNAYPHRESDDSWPGHQ